MEIRILVVDDSEPWRCFLASSFQELPEFEIVSEAADGLQAVQKAKELQPNLVLLDVGLPKLNGIAAARQIHALVPESKILIISQESSTFMVEEALRMGASGYVVKSDAGSELLTAVHAVLRGERFVGDRFAGHDFSAAAADAGVAGNDLPHDRYLPAA